MVMIGVCEILARPIRLTGGQRAPIRFPDCRLFWDLFRVILDYFRHLPRSRGSWAKVVANDNDRSENRLVHYWRSKLQ